MHIRKHNTTTYSQNVVDLHVKILQVDSFVELSESFFYINIFFFLFSISLLFTDGTYEKHDAVVKYEYKGHLKYIYLHVYAGKIKTKSVVFVEETEYFMNFSYIL